MIHTITLAGNGHANEDVVGHRVHPDDAHFVLCALADGQGGQPRGAAAARIAVDLVLGAASASKPRSLLSPSAWLDLGSAADRRVAEDRDAGYCALAALVVTPDWVVGASCGDSSALLLLENWEFILTDRQRKNPPVGSRGARFEPFSSGVPGWCRILMMSDGVWKYAGWERVIKHGRGQGCQALMGVLEQEAKDRSGGSLPDDFSMIVIEPQR